MAAASLESFVESFGLYPARTYTGKPSVTNEWLETTGIQELQDVAHYRPLLADYMRRYGYDDDWAIAAEPCIRPEECSEYVLRLVRERQGTLRPAATGD